MKLDNHGWADVSELILKSKSHCRFTFEELCEVVDTNEKKRFAFNDDRSKIRASQGHSVKVDLGLKAVTPPPVLYHGTADRFLESIKKTGLRKMQRNHVHLSSTAETAVSVGARHGRVVVLEIDASRMSEDGYEFFLSENGVWLTDHVPVEYINEY